MKFPKFTSFVCSQEFYDEIRKCCKDNNVSLGEYIRTIISYDLVKRGYLKDNKKEVDK